MALFAWMYFAALRPGEAVALRRQDGHLPCTELGWLTLEKSRPEVNRRWSDTDSAHPERGLKHRAVTETGRVPIPPELVAILWQHIDTFGTALDGRIFASERGHAVASTAISEVWADTRALAFTREQMAFPTGRPTIRLAARGSLTVAQRRSARHRGRRAGRAQRPVPAVRLRQLPR
jgi:integrase